MDKPEFPPLFQPGLHDINFKDWHIHFVNPFGNKERRLKLAERFTVFMERFAEIGVSAEIWVDGSYSTAKEEPDDIDVLFIMDSNLLNKLSEDRQKILVELFDRNLSKIRYGCDILFADAADDAKRSYWRGWFGFSRLEVAKGIPRFHHVSN